MHQILAELCPFENFRKLLPAYCFRGNSVQILFYNRYIFLQITESYGHMGKLFVVFFSSSFIRFAQKSCRY